MADSPGRQEFGRACVALQAGDLPAARGALARARAAEPDRSEVRVLEALIEERERAPRGTWLPAFSRAWSRAGKPKGTEWTHPRSVEERVEEVAAQYEQHKDYDRLVSDLARKLLPRGSLTGALDTARAEEWVERILPDALEPAPLAVRLWKLQVFRQKGLRPETRERVFPVMAELVEQLGREYADDLYLSLLAIGGTRDKDEPLAETELSALVRITREATGCLTLEELYVELRDLHAESGPVTGRRMAWVDAAKLHPTDLLLTLRLRAQHEAEAPTPRRRQLLGDAFAGLASRLSGRTTLMELIWADEFTHLASRWTTAPLPLEQVRRARDEAYAASKAVIEIDGWPLPSLACEYLDALASDEVGVYRMLRDA